MEQYWVMRLPKNMSPNKECSTERSFFSSHKGGSAVTDSTVIQTLYTSSQVDRQFPSTTALSEEQCTEIDQQAYGEIVNAGSDLVFQTDTAVLKEITYQVHGLDVCKLDRRLRQLGYCLNASELCTAYGHFAMKVHQEERVVNADLIYIAEISQETPCAV